MSRPKQPSIFIRNSPAAPQLCPELAKEIGLNESILLLQFEYWLTRHGELRDDGHVWIRKPVREIQETFSFWSVGTVNGIIESLTRKGYVETAGLDKVRGKSGRWLRLNLDTLAALKSIRVCSESEQSMFRNTPDLVQDLNNRPYIDLKNKSISPSGYKSPKSPPQPKTLYPPDDFKIESWMRSHLAERFIAFSETELTELTKDWRVARNADSSRKRDLWAWQNDWLRYICATWRNRSNNGNGHKREEEDSGSGYPSFMAPPKPADYFERVNAEFRGK